MAKEDDTPRTNPAEIENLIEQIRKTNLEPGAKEKAAGDGRSAARGSDDVGAM